MGVYSPTSTPHLSLIHISTAPLPFAPAAPAAPSAIEDATAALLSMGFTAAAPKPTLTIPLTSSSNFVAMEAS